MTKLCDFTFTFDKQDRIYEVGERVTGTLHLTPTRRLPCRGVSLRLFWRTHGRGNKTRGESITVETDFREPTLEPAQTYSVPFSFDAPPGPLTYRGHYLNVDWYLGTTLDLPRRPGLLDPKAETEFMLLPAEGVSVDLGPAYDVPLTSDVFSGGAVQWSAVIFGFVFSSFALVFMLTALVVSAGALPSILFLIIPSIFFLLGLFIIFGGLRNRLAQGRLGVVEVSLSERELMPGDTLTCQVSFTPTRPFELRRVRFRLEAKEKVVSGSGTNKTTHTHTAFEEIVTPLELQSASAGRKVEAAQTFTLPLDAPYTFAADDNKLLWTLNVLIDTKGPLDWSRDYPLAVVPWRDTEPTL